MRPVYIGLSRFQDLFEQPLKSPTGHVAQFKSTQSSVQMAGALERVDSMPLLLIERGPFLLSDKNINERNVILFPSFFNLPSLK